MARALVVEIIGDATGLERAFKKAGVATGAFSDVTARLGRVAAVTAGAAGLGALALITKDGIQQAEKLKVAQESLATAIGHTGGDVATLAPQYAEVAKRAAEFGVNQTDATTALSRATLLTGNAENAMRSYQEALVISKATGRDFEQVLTATSKALDGHTSSLQRYGIQISSTTPAQDQFNQVMDRFGGQAEANTTQTEKLRANFQNLETSIGTALLPAFNALVSGMNDAVVWAETHWPQFENAIKTAFHAVETAVHALESAFKAAFDAARTVVNIFKGDVETYLRGVWEVISGIVKLVDDVFHGRWGQVWHDAAQIVTGFKDEIVGVVGTLRDFLNTVFSALGTSLAAILKAPINAVIDLIDAIEVPKIHIPFFGDIGGFKPFNIPHLAAGGIVTAPTLALIGESGPEAVVPLRGGGMGDTLNFHFHGAVGSKQDIQDWVVEALTRYRGRNGLTIV